MCVESYNECKNNGAGSIVQRIGSRVVSSLSELFTINKVIHASNNTNQLNNNILEDISRILSYQTSNTSCLV